MQHLKITYDKFAVVFLITYAGKQTFKPMRCEFIQELVLFLAFVSTIIFNLSDNFYSLKKAEYKKLSRYYACRYI